MFFFAPKKQQHELGCLICHVVVTVLLFLTVIAAIVGALLAHYDIRNDAMVFGTAAGSLSLIALALCSTLWMKSMKSCMGNCEVCWMDTTKKGKK